MIIGLTDRKFGANGFYASPKYLEQYEEVRTSITSLSYKSKIKNLTIKPRVYWRWNKDKYLFIRNNPGAYQNLHETNTLGAEVNSSYLSNFGTTGFGLEYRKEEIVGDWVRGGNESKSNLDGFHRDNFGIYADHKFKIGNRLDITPGIYVNWYSDFGWNAFPGMDIGYYINDNIRLYGNLGKSYRIPTFYDQYYSSPVEEGNADLKPEEALTYELGMRYGRISVSAISYDNCYFAFGEQFRSCTLKGLSCCAVCFHLPVFPVKILEYASKGPSSLASAVISDTRDDHLAPSAAETQENLNRRGSIPRNVINSRKARSFRRAW